VGDVICKLVEPWLPGAMVKAAVDKPSTALQPLGTESLRWNVDGEQLELSLLVTAITYITVAPGCMDWLIFGESVTVGLALMHGVVLRTYVADADPENELAEELVALAEKL
jgi:hypothetical protein